MNFQRASRWRIVSAVVAVAVLGLVVAAGLFYWTSFERRVAWEGDAGSLDALLENWAELGSVPGVLLEVWGPEGVVFDGAAGSPTTEGTDRLSTQTPFHTASVGKLFTAATVLRLHEEGLLDIDQPAALYLDPGATAGLVVVNGNDHGEEITVRQLLSHRGGLGNTDDDLRFGLWILRDPELRRSPESLLDHARRIGAVGRPGERTAYSSPGYFLLGRVIEGATGMPYAAAVRQYLLERVGMQATFEATSEWKREALVLHHYVGWTDFSRFDPSFEFADGGFVSTTGDLLRFGKAMVEGSLFEKEATHALFLAPPPGAEEARRYIALGPHLVHPEEGPTLILHSGYWGALLVVYPEAGVSAAMTLAQSTADLGLFWSQAREILVREYGILPAPPADR